MIIELADATATEVAQALLAVRRTAGSPAMGMVMTMVVVCEEREYDAALAEATQVGREHPSRVMLVVRRRRGRPGMRAEVRIGDGSPGETVILWLQGPVADHAAPVVLPLLLPDTPVVVWWPGQAPERPAEDPVGQLGNRRLTDSATAAQLVKRVEHAGPGDADLAWTRLTRWRALLAAALDQYRAQVRSASVSAQRGSAPAALLAAWLAGRLEVPVQVRSSPGPGLTDVRLSTAAGDITISRADGVLAAYAVPGQPLRQVALPRRPLTELLGEELRRLDPDLVYLETAEHLLERTRAKQPATRAAEATPQRTAEPATKRARRASPPRRTEPTSKRAAARGKR